MNEIRADCGARSDPARPAERRLPARRLLQLRRHDFPVQGRRSLFVQRRDVRNGIADAEEAPVGIAQAVRIGRKEAFGGHDAKRVDLTLTEFQIVRLLANSADTDVSYRQIYDLVRGKDFIAGYGEEGYRVNVRSFIKRIRQKFRDVDDSIDCIENYPGFGYRWVDAD